MAEEDVLSPFYKREYSEFEYTQTLYNYFIHPQWDDFGSKTLYMKLLNVDYDYQFAILELIGEWNDAIENDIMTLRRNITDVLFKNGITKFIIISENVLNFHSSDDSYYEDWKEQLEDDNGWVAILNMPQQSQYDFKKYRITNYINFYEMYEWRTYKPELIFQQIDNYILRQLS